MFSKGDKIVYPLYGAGIIEDLEEKDLNGVRQLYYVLRIPIGDLKIMISVFKAEDMGIREIYSKEKIEDIISAVCALPVDMSDNWAKRYKENMVKIKSGKLEEVILVFRNLRERERARGLSTAEKKMMTIAKQIILSELILAHDIERGSAENILTQSFAR
ncbi:MAG: hypothetical protein FWG65_04575 [Turicibacter sp.]|nr:hypothetical protein [Turicibacter sp.]